MRYFFDVAHGARIVVSHASVTYVAVFHSRDSLHQPLTKSVGAAPILVLKNPLALAGGVARAGKMLGKITGAGTKQAGLFDATAGKAAPSVAVTNPARLLPENASSSIKPPDPSLDPPKLEHSNLTPDATRDMTTGSHAPDTTNHVEVTPSSDKSAHPYATLDDNMAGVEYRAGQAKTSEKQLHELREDLDTEKEKSRHHGGKRDARDKLQERVGLGAMGLMHMSGRAQQKQAELEAEQQRMMQQRGTENANTGGGRVAVTA